jgi:ATP-binding cassette subfamily C protein
MNRNRSGFAVMAGLIGMIKPMLGIMFLAVLMGCIGNLMATFITVLGGYGLLTVTGYYGKMSLTLIITLMAVFAVLRGVLRYAEQACNHFIAFKLLARIRHQVFTALRKLSPAKLDGSEKGNLISIITSDIELLEVFYAHTISPIAITFITSVVMCIYLGSMSVVFAVIAFCLYLIVGVLIPLWNGRRGSAYGKNYRDAFGRLNTTVLDNLYGLEETIQYGRQAERMMAMSEQNDKLEQVNQTLKNQERTQRIVTDWVILASGIVMAYAGSYLVNRGAVEGYEAVIAVIAIMSSFGPTAALSALSNNLNQTLACGNRVLNLLGEEPVVCDVENGTGFQAGDIDCENISFSYEDKPVLSDFSQVFEQNKIHGILGKSGCGKSTLLKLLMRFYETDGGTIRYGAEDVNAINTDSLRKHIAYVTQETFLFHDTIENNIKVAKADATREEVIEAAKKASIHEFICSLPNDYETNVAELGSSLSGGERQRIGIARAFLHDCEVIFLDEPTSNIDSLNEGMILKSLQEEKEEKTILLVSHRKSTMGITDQMTVFE